MLFHDRAIIDGPARITPEGHFVAKARVARANNIQDYRAEELDLPPKADGSAYRIFRPEASIFAKDSLASALHRPIVIDHPAEDVTAANWKKLSVGDTGGEIMRDGETMVVPIMIMDAAGVEAVQGTHPEFSWGYSSELDMTPGTFGDQAYDGSITPPRYNHLAMCRRARGGSDLRVTDSLVILDERPVHLRDHQEKTMKIKIGDAEVDLGDGAAVALAVGTLNATLADERKQKETALADVATLTTEKSALEATNTTLQSQLADAKMTPEKLRDAAKSYQAVVDKAKALGVTVTDAMDEPAIMKAAVAAKLGDKASGWTDVQIAASFDTMQIADAAAKPGIGGSPVVIGDSRTAIASSRAAWLLDKQTAHRAPLGS